MSRFLLLFVSLILASACSASTASSTSASNDESSAPFVKHEVASFNQPWAIGT